MLGELEQVVLLAVLRVGEEAYGVPVQREIARQTGRDLTLATIHKTLSRLEDKALVRSRTGEPTPMRGGRRRRYYAVTAEGQHALREALGALRRLAHGLPMGFDVP